MRLVRLLGVVLIGLLISALGFSAQVTGGEQPQLPAPYATSSIENPPGVVPPPPGSSPMSPRALRFQYLRGILRKPAGWPWRPAEMFRCRLAGRDASSSIVIIAGHYDTKRTNLPFVGANDGGSSAAFLLEVARVLARRNNRLTYWLVFFDGEESLQRWSATDGLYGSRHFAQELSGQGILQQIRAVILVDMIADAHLDIRREAHSTPWLTDIVFAQAQRLGYGRYFLNSPRTIEDDHIPFLELGVPAVDIIDLDYGPFNLYWHTRYDTVDKCSPGSLGIVERVVLGTLATPETNPTSHPGGASP